MGAHSPPTWHSLRLATRSMLVFCSSTSVLLSFSSVEFSASRLLLKFCARKWCALISRGLKTQAMTPFVRGFPQRCLAQHACPRALPGPGDGVPRAHALSGQPDPGPRQVVVISSRTVVAIASWASRPASPLSCLLSTPSCLVFATHQHDALPFLLLDALLFALAPVQQLLLGHQLLHLRLQLGLFLRECQGQTGTGFAAHRAHARPRDAGARTQLCVQCIGAGDGWPEP